MYDNIVIGPGSAGCVLANHLTEDPETSVILLEVTYHKDASSRVKVICPSTTNEGSASTQEYRVFH